MGQGPGAADPQPPVRIAVTDGGVPAAELAKITAPVLILGGANSPGWFQRSVAEQAAATPGAQLRMLDGFDHNAPVEVIAPILAGSSAHPANRLPGSLMRPPLQALIILSMLPGMIRSRVGWPTVQASPAAGSESLLTPGRLQ